MSRAARARACATVLALVVVSACAGTTPRPRNGETAAVELERFSAFVREAHPAPFRFVAESEFDAAVEAEAERLRALPAPSELEVGLAFQRIVASVRDVHMQVALPSFQPGYDGRFELLPFVVAIAGDEILVDASGSSEIPVGHAIRAIDGVSVDEILAAFAPLAIAEGRNGDARRQVVARDFVKLHLLAYGMQASHTVTIADAEEATSIVEVASIGRVAYDALVASRRTRAIRAASADVWPTVVRELDGTPRMLLPTFGVADTEAYAARITELADAIADEPRLILDLRGNEGGLRTNGIALANHFASAPYVQWQGLGVAVRAIPERFERAVEPAFGTSLDRLRAFPDTRSNGSFRIEGDPLASFMTPAMPLLTPELVVLVDGLTGSAANEFALALRTLRPDATFVGEEIGGGCDRHVGELPVTYTTETFGVVVLVSLIELTHLAVPGCVEGHGLVPDVRAVLDAERFREGRDVAVEAASASW